MTFAAELAKQGHRPWVSVEIAGLGRRLGAVDAATRDAYRWCLEVPAGSIDGSLHLDRLIPGLLDVPQSLSESIDVRGGTTDLGQLELQLLLGEPCADDTHGWADAHPTLDLLSGRAPAQSWRLLWPCTAGQVTLHVVADGAALPVAGQALWLGAETAIVESALAVCPVHGASCSQFTVVRGQYGSLDVPHPAWDTTPPGDGLVWSHPRSIRGRKVTLRIAFPDPAIEPIGGWNTLLPLSEERVLFSGTIDDGKIDGPGTMRLAATSILGRLNRSIGRRQWSGLVTGFGRLALAIDPNAAGEQILAVTSAGLQPPDYPEQVAPAGGYYRRFYARLANQIVLCRWSSVDATTGSGWLLVEQWGCLGTDPRSGLDSVDPVPIWDVLLTSPAPARSYADGEVPFTLCNLLGPIDLEPTAHPADLIQLLTNSTGLGTNGFFDLLPEHWGVGIPVAETDSAAFRRLKEETAGVSFPNLVIGWEGKPEALRALLEREFLAPLGWFLFQDSLGRVSVSRLVDAYPQVSYVTLVEDDVIIGSVSIDLALQDTVSAQDWAHDWSWAAGEFQRHTRFEPRELDQLLEDNSELQIEARGLGRGEGATLIGARSRNLSYWFSSPIPRISLSVHLDLLLDVDLGDVILLDGIRWPDPLAPSAASWDRAALVVGRTVVLRGSPSLQLVLYPLPGDRTGLWAPAATAVSWVAGTKKLTVEDHDYSDPDNDVVDAARFVAGDVVSLISSRGVDRVDVALVVASVVGSVVEFTAAPSSGGGAYTPVAGDVLVFARWFGSANPPAGAWQVGQRAYVAQADETTVLLPDGTTAPYQLGA